MERKDSSFSEYLPVHQKSLLTSSGPPLIRRNCWTVQHKLLCLGIIRCSRLQAANECPVTEFCLRVRSDDTQIPSLWSNWMVGTQKLLRNQIDLCFTFPIHSACCSTVPWPMIVGKNITKCTPNGFPCCVIPGPRRPPNKALKRVELLGEFKCD